MTDERINTGYAALQTDSGDVPVQVSGVAIGENDVTRGGSGKETLWPPETLKASAEGLMGQPLATDTNHTADDPKAQTPVEAIAGEITWSGYKPGVGVLYEAEVDDPDLATKIANGRVEVSPLVSRELEALESGDADYKATDITRWRDLALVAQGAAPSNEITVGSNPMKAEALHAAIESLQADLTPPEDVQEHAQEVLEWRDEYDVSAMTDTGWDRAEQLASGEELSVDDVQEISAWFARHGSEEYSLNDEGMDPWTDNGRVAIKGWGGPPMRSWIMDKREQLVDDGELEALSAEALMEVAGVEFDGTAEGDLDESEIPTEGYESHYLYPGDTKSESSYPVVSGDGMLMRGNVDAAHQLGARGDVDGERHDERLMALAQEFDTPPEWSMDDAESMADIGDLSEDTLVSWNSSGDRDAYGMVVDVREEGDEPLDGEIDGDVTVDPPAALIEVHTPGTDGWNATDTMVGHKPDTLSVVDSLPDPESLAQSDDGPNGGGAQSSVAADSEETMSELTDDEKAILQAAEGVDEPTEALNEYAATEQAEIVEQHDYEAMQDNIESVRGVMEEALMDRTDLKESTVAALGFEALRSEFETEDGDLDAEALVQHPETGDPEEGEDEALGEDADVAKAEALYADMDTFGVDHEDTICETLGVDDFEDAEEVLN